VGDFGFPLIEEVPGGTEPRLAVAVGEEDVELVGFAAERLRMISARSSQKAMVLGACCFFFTSSSSRKRRASRSGFQDLRQQGGIPCADDGDREVAKGFRLAFMTRKVPSERVVPTVVPTQATDQTHARVAELLMPPARTGCAWDDGRFQLGRRTK
jgi:hypothetical protein